MNPVRQRMKHTFANRSATRHRQRGLGALFTSVILLFLASVFMIAVSRSLLLEQRMSANEVRSKQAFEAAQAGLDAAMNYLQSSPRASDQNNDGVADDVAAVALANGTTYRYAFCVPQMEGAAAPTTAYSCPEAVGARPVCDYVDGVAGVADLLPGFTEADFFATPAIVSCGWSDDGLGRRIVQQSVGVIGGEDTNGPSNPLTAKGSINVGGSATVVNYFNNLNIWSGGAIDNTGASARTFVRNPATELPPPGTAPPTGNTLFNNCNNTVDSTYTCTSKTAGVEMFDVIDRDPTLSNLSTDEMFRNTFGMTKTDYANTAQVNISGADIANLDRSGGQSVYIDGSVSLSGTYGSRDKPVKMVINGNLDATGGPTIFGIVYVTGNISGGGGNVQINGAAVTEQAVSVNGSLTVIYDPTIVRRAGEQVGRPGLIPGTWRDW